VHGEHTLTALGFLPHFNIVSPALGHHSMQTWTFHRPTINDRMDPSVEADVFDPLGKTAESLDLKPLHTKNGQLVLELDFLNSDYAPKRDCRVQEND